MKNQQEDMTVEQAARLLRISRSTINRAVRDKLIPAHYRGVIRAISKETVRAIELAIQLHGKYWAKNLPWNKKGEEIQPELPEQPQFFQGPQIVPSEDLRKQMDTRSELVKFNKQNTLKDMIRTLKHYNEFGLAQAVTERLVELL